MNYNLMDFLSRSTDRPFSETTLSGILDDLPILSANGPWLAGGALRRTIQGKEPDSDFDFFFKDANQLSSFEAELMEKGLLKVKETEHHLQYSGRVGSSERSRDIQLIRFKFYQDAEEVVESFDFTICQFAFDGTDLITGDFSLWDLGRKRLAVHKITFPVSSMRRVLKYTRQGFTACNGCLATLLRATAENPELRLDIAYVD